VIIVDSTLTQDGAGIPQNLRSDAGAEIRRLDEFLREWRQILSLLLLGPSRLRPCRARRHLCSGLPADGGSPCYGVMLLQQKIPRRQDRTLEPEA